MFDKEIVNKAIDRAIVLLKGKPLKFGAIISHDSTKAAYNFTKYDGENVVCELNGETRFFPKLEVYDINEVKNMSMILTVKAMLEEKGMKELSKLNYI